MGDKGDVGAHGDDVTNGDGCEDAVDGGPHGAARQDDDVEGVGGDAEDAYHQAEVPVNTPVPVDEDSSSSSFRAKHHNKCGGGDGGGDCDDDDDDNDDDNDNGGDGGAGAGDTEDTYHQAVIPQHTPVPVDEDSSSSSFRAKHHNKCW